MSGAEALATDVDWLARQARALYEHDGVGRIVHFRDADAADPDVPLFFFARSRHGNTWRFSHRLSDPLLRELARLAGAEPLEPDPANWERPPTRAEAWLERIRSEHAVRVVWGGPAFYFPDALPDAADAEILDADALREASFDAWPEVAPFARRGPVAVVRSEGRIVAACYCATADGPAVEAGVETLEGHRGRGFAPRVVARWARAMRAAGRIPLYSTGWDNRASRAVARKLGLVLYGADWHVRGDPPA